ncbi:MAG: class I SAM-dependent methyltransferase [Alphaproteobacteria bacterium]
MPPSDKDVIASNYDDWSDWYPYIHGSVDAAVDDLTQVADHTLKSRLPGGLVLDAGCGTGLSTRALLNCGYDVLGVDLSQKSLARAADWLGPEFGDRVRFEAADLLDLPETLDGKFDGIFAATSVLAHMQSEEELAALMDGFARVLKPGGIAAFTHYDYQRLMAHEPDVAPMPPLYSEDDDGPFVFLQRRFWSGTPRGRHYRTEYIRLALDGDVRRIEQQYRASTLQEVSALLTAAGFDAIAWSDPSETGFFQSACTTTKTPVPDDHYRRSGLELPESVMQPPTDPDQAPARFRFFPEDLDRNPFEEEPNHSEGTLQQARKEDGTLVLIRRKQVTLVMLSGGIDSVYVLQRLLRESEDEIIAHHIHFINIEGRDRAEADACARIVEHLKKTVRPFVYTESAIDRRRFQGFGMDDMAVAFEVGVISTSFMIDRGFGIDRWTSGTCLEEELEYYGEQEVERFEHVLNTAAASCYPNPAPRFFQLKIIPKRDQMTYMGPELVDLCWTCRAPVWDGDTPRECGTCKTCSLMNEIRAGKETIPHRHRQTPADLEI